MDGYATLDGELTYEAVWDDSETWPRFTLDTVKKMAADFQRLYQDGDIVYVLEVPQSKILPYRTDGLYVDDETLVEGPPERFAVVLLVSYTYLALGSPATECTHVINPDKDGLYSIGDHNNWCWEPTDDPIGAQQK